MGTGAAEGDRSCGGGSQRLRGCAPCALRASVSPRRLRSARPSAPALLTESGLACEWGKEGYEGAVRNCMWMWVGGYVQRCPRTAMCPPGPQTPVPVPPACPRQP